MQINKFFVFMLLITSFIFAQIKIETDSSYAVQVKASDGVILSCNSEIRIEDYDEMNLTLSGQNLIKNKYSEELGKFLFHESEFVKIDEVYVVIKDTSGNILKELDKEEINYNSISAGSVFYTEDKDVFFELHHTSYPYIVDYKIKIDYESLFFLPDWYPQNSYPVNSASLKIFCDPIIKFKWHNIGCYISPEITDKDLKCYQWKIQNIPEKPDEKYLAPENSYGFKILFSPIKFKLGETEGTFESWKKSAKWFNELYQNKLTLSEKIKHEIKELIKDCNTEKKIIEKLYKFLQTKTRYVAIYTDIGSWEPHKAEEVYNNGFGDCKDLTVMMISMLKTAGIKSYPAFVKTRDEGIVISDFPSNQFNHVVAFVPLEKDTLWLECTSDYLNYNEISSSLQETEIFVVKENPEIIKIPASKAEQNIWKSKTDCSITSEGIQIITEIKVTGNQKQFFYPLLESTKLANQKIFISRLMSENWGRFSLKEYSYNNSENQDTLIINIRGKYNSRLNKRIFIQPSIFSVCTTNRLITDEKNYPFYHNCAYRDFDLIRIKIPENYKVEKLTKQKSFSSKFAEYKTNCTASEGIIEFSRSYSVLKKHIPQNSKDEYNSLIKTMIKGDKSKIVLKKALF